MRVVNLASGSKGNCTLFEFASTAYLVDCGICERELVQKLDFVGCPIEKLSGVFVTHLHSDHVSGVVKFCNKHKIPVFAKMRNWEEAESRLRPAKTSLFGLSEGLKRVIFEEVFCLDECEVSVFDVSHDAPSTVGFVFSDFNKRVGIVSDIGVFDATALNFLQGADLVFIESNHDEEMLRTGDYPFVLKQRILSSKGHLSNNQCAEAVVELAKKGTRFFVLMHLSEENNDPQIARSTIFDGLAKAGLDAENISVFVSDQYKISKNFILG